jgi:preprotein translocase, SecE subunit, bacterial
MADKEKKAADTAAKAEVTGDKESTKVQKAEKPEKPKVTLGERLSKFWREYKSELKKIVWFSREDTIRSTVLVLVTIAVVSVVISALDMSFSTALLALGRLI